MQDNEDDDLFVPLRPLLSDRSDRHRERRAQPPRRLRGLSRDDIVTTAMAVADAEGTEAVSMRRIAREMRAGAMSLYWYVSSKEELHQLMLERVQAESEAPLPTGDWRADLRTYAYNARAALLRHPWAIDFLGNGPPSGPNDAQNAERVIAAFDGLAIDLRTVMYITTTVATYVLGAVFREVQEIRWHRAADKVAAQWSQTEIADFLGEFERRIRQSGRYPHLVRLLDEGFDPDSPQTRDERFDFGLNCVLDGIAARLPAT